jgi:hypothetical protein
MRVRGAKSAPAEFTARLSVSRQTAATSRPNFPRSTSAPPGSPGDQAAAEVGRRLRSPAKAASPRSPLNQYPGGVGTIPSVQVFTEYMTRILLLHRAHPSARGRKD